MRVPHGGMEDAGQEERAVGVSAVGLVHVGLVLRVLLRVEHVAEVETARAAVLVGREEFADVDVGLEHRADVVDDGGVVAVAADVEHLDDEEVEERSGRERADLADVVVDGGEQFIDGAREAPVGGVAAVVAGDDVLQFAYALLYQHRRALPRLAGIVRERDRVPQPDAFSRALPFDYMFGLRGCP